MLKCPPKNSTNLTRDDKISSPLEAKVFHKYNYRPKVIFPIVHSSHPNNWQRSNENRDRMSEE